VLDEPPAGPHHDGPLRISFPVGDEDQRGAIRALVVRQPLIRWVRVGAVVIPVLMIAWSMSAGWPFHLAVFRNLFWIVVGALELLFLVPMSVRKAVEASRRADPHWAEDQVLTLGDATLELQGASTRSEVPWSQVERAVETRDVLLLYTRTGRVLYIPVRAVVEQTMLPKVRALLRSRLGARARLAADA
jgi:hypothetical protein